MQAVKWGIGQNQMRGWASWLPFLLAILMAMTEGEASAYSQLHIRLRDSKGTAVVGETVILQRLPEEEPIAPNCTTDTNGECAWTVGRGLYQVLFERPLDNISALAVAEGGLRGLGITVGDEDITYPFTFHSDGRVYFDAAPQAAVPSPIIPEGDVLHGGIVPTPALTVIEDEPAKETTTPVPTHVPETAVRTTSGSSWRLILFIGGGLVIGGGLHFLRLGSGQAWSRKKQTANQKNEELKKQTTTQPNDEETNHA